MKTALTLTLAAVMLSGCVGMSRSSTVAPLAADWKSGGRVDQVILAKEGEFKITPEFDQIFESRVKGKLAECATGTRPLRLEAKLTRLDKANPVITTLIMGANVMRGEAKLVDVATGQTVGQYQIGQTVVGGRMAIVKMGEAEEQMSDAFGEELCKQAFKAEPAK
ncbi:hypothetical protein [Caulobacter sp. NIBR2454]|uniref:hypothetical protein n=1 Tax=Caulobacter sp. NIBR2454 TaxID=3015996 RepID=UPI0022B60DEF|nr:hypothetical protein [Caulobacter sp. NIBR2454]